MDVICYSYGNPRRTVAGSLRGSVYLCSYCMRTCVLGYKLSIFYMNNMLYAFIKIPEVIF